MVLAIAIGFNFWLNEESVDVADTTVSSPQVPVPPNKSAQGSGIPVPKLPPVASFKPGSKGPAVSNPAEAITAPSHKNSKPEFDVVRINPEGDTVIAGRALPGAKVRIFDGGDLIGMVTADERGEWVYLPTKPLPAGKRELSLTATNPDGLEAESEAVVVLAVPVRDGSEQKVGVDENKAMAGGTESTSEVKAPAQGALAVLVQRDGSRPSRVLQKPTEKGGGVRRGSLSIEVVDYDEAGNISIGGKGKPGETVQVYLNNNLVGRAIATSEGEWLVEPKVAVPPGLYKLRADSISSARVTARVEIPFSRAAPVQTIAGESLVIVQPGNSLWRIARRTMGSGMKFTMIYDANRAQILDPDMIFPGQVFALPRTN